MVTDIITVSGAEGQETALRQAEKTAVYQELSPKGALHLRLLTEEMMGLMRTVTGAPDAQFWIENEDGEYRLHLKVETLLSTEKKEASLTGAGMRTAWRPTEGPWECPICSREAPPRCWTGNGA